MTTADQTPEAAGRQGEARPVALLLAGPTASGKSALALRLAAATGGVIINADSMQVYADLAVLSARPEPADMLSQPHRLYGTVDGAENFSVGRYLLAAREVLGQCAARHKAALIVGGTGLYFRALEQGLSDIPEIPQAVRESERAACAGIATADLHARLQARDPAEAQRLRPTDRLRIMRALEVLAATGRPITDFHAAREPGPLAGWSVLRWFLAPDRGRLHAAIDHRFEQMMARGALDEVRALKARGLDPMLPVMRAHGVPGLLAHLDGQIDLAEAVRRGQADTRAYVKRQFTWFRHQMPQFRWIGDDVPRDTLIAQAQTWVASDRGPDDVSLAIAALTR